LINGGVRGKYWGAEPTRRFLPAPPKGFFKHLRIFFKISKVPLIIYCVDHFHFLNPPFSSTSIFLHVHSLCCHLQSTKSIFYLYSLPRSFVVPPLSRISHLHLFCHRRCRSVHCRPPPCQLSEIY